MSTATSINTRLAALLDFVRLARKQHPHLILNLYAVAEFTAAAKAALPGERRDPQRLGHGRG